MVDKLQKILIQGTRLSLAMVVPLATVLGLTARPLVLLWVERRVLFKVV